MGMGGSASKGGAAGNLTVDINVTPMVDVMLVLLIIFMVVTPLLQSGVAVALPNGDNPDQDENITKDGSIVVSIPTDGIYYVNRDQVQGKESLIQAIKSKVDALTEGRPRVVYIKGGTNVNYGEVVEVVDAIREAEVDNIGLVAEKKKRD
jgi:biopolymer transport protein TolR